jgi:sugar phosphate isomerase/epimerase
MSAFTRREFSKAVAAAAGIACAPASAMAIQPIGRTGGPRMKLSLAAYSFRKYLTDYRHGATPKPGAMTLESFVDLCAAYPLSGVELTSYYVPEPVPDGYLARLRRRAFLLGFTVSGTAIGNTFTHPPGAKRDEEIAYTKRWIDRASELGAQTIRIFAGNVQKGTTEAQARQWCIEAIRECCAYAGSRGVILALENHGGIVTTAEQLLSIVREVDSEWFGVNWDSGNFKSADAYAELAAIAPYAVTAQIKVKIGSPTGPKEADWQRVVGILTNVGYRGWLALEYEEEEDPKTAVPRLLDRLNGLIAPAVRATE